MNGVTATRPESFDHDSDRTVFESLSDVYGLQGIAILRQIAARPASKSRDCYIE